MLFATAIITYCADKEIYTRALKRLEKWRGLEARVGDVPGILIIYVG